MVEARTEITESVALFPTKLHFYFFFIIIIEAGTQGNPLAWVYSLKLWYELDINHTYVSEIPGQVLFQRTD